jgi:hypothetical protein
MVRAIAYLLVKTLGFETISASTANWAGRIDHFLVFKDQLFLFKIEASLRPEDKDISPPDARRETRLIYELMTSYEGSEEKEIIRVHQYQYFISDDLRINFTGELELSYPVGDPWDYPWPLSEEDLDPTEMACFQDDWLMNAEICNLEN